MGRCSGSGLTENKINYFWEVNTMANNVVIEKTESGLEILKKAESTIHGRTVILTRKTNKAGEIRHGVVLETRRGGHHKIGTFEGLAPAFKAYKALVK